VHQEPCRPLAPNLCPFGFPSVPPRRKHRVLCLWTAEGEAPYRTATSRLERPLVTAFVISRASGRWQIEQDLSGIDRPRRFKYVGQLASNQARSAKGKPTNRDGHAVDWLVAMAARWFSHRSAHLVFLFRGGRFTRIVSARIRWAARTTSAAVGAAR
jgi:hypothetical protein